jgi:hypothetical protein
LFSSETEPTLWRTIPYLELLQHHWETILETPKNLPVSEAVEKGLDKLGKWYKSLEQTDSYFICLGVLAKFSIPHHNLCRCQLLALHLSFKLSYCKNKWDCEAYDAGYASLKKVVHAVIFSF